MKDFIKLPPGIGLKITINADKPADVLVKVTDKDSGAEIVNEIMKVATENSLRVKAVDGEERSLMVESYPVTSGVIIIQRFNMLRPRSEQRNYILPKWDWHPGGNVTAHQSAAEAGAFLLLEADTSSSAYVLQQDGGGKIKLQNSD